MISLKPIYLNMQIKDSILDDVKHLKVYHYPKCARSRKGLKYLQSFTSGLTVVDYVKEGISVGEIKEIMLKLNIRPFDLIRFEEPVYKKEYKGMNFTDDEWIIILSENPKLLRRPLIIAQYKGTIGYPVENINSIFKK
jgi:arsenate reductase (glutaredoxin)